MSAILGNLVKTLSPRKLLESIKRLDPEMANRIQGVLGAGFTVDQIMKIIDKPENQKRFKDHVAKSQVDMSANPLVAAEETRKGAKAQDLATRYGKQAQQVGKGVALAAGYLATRGLSSLFDMPNDRKEVFANPDEILPAQKALPGPQMKRGLPAPGPQAPTQPPPSPQGPQPAPPMGQGTAQTPGPLTPPQAQQAPAVPNPKHAYIIKQMGIGNVIEGLASKENPQTIAQVLDQHFLKPEQKKWLQSQTDQPLDKIVEDYLALKPQEQAPEVPKEREFLKGKTPEDILAKNEAILPSGDIGSIESVHKGVATVNVDGKKKQLKEEDLIQSPLPEKDMATLYEDLIQSIPESERSAVINVAGYDPNHNELIFMPHDGALYVYKDIPPDFAEKLKSAMFKAKTTGENFYGAWAQGESSRFAGLHLLIKELQAKYGGKGKEYVRKYEKIYDFLELPKAAKKAKEKKEREEERARQGKKPRKPKPS